MSTLDGLFAVWTGLGSLGMILFFLDGAWRFFRLKRLDQQTSRAPDPWPKLSVVVAACNEGETIASALSSLVATDYPSVEYVVINDRSTDDTGDILNTQAANHDAIKPLHLESLPEGWLGKVHALHRGVEASSGEWLLFTDADVHFTPGVIRTAVAYAEDRGLDHLAVLPDFHSESVWAEAAMAGFGLIFVTRTRADRVAEPDSGAFAGVGAFNMVRRGALERTRGFEQLRMEVADDVGLGWMLRQSGARSEFLVGGAGLSIIWYPTLLSMMRGLGKNSFGTSCHFSYFRLLWLILACWFGLLAPLAAPILWPLGAGWAWLAGWLVSWALWGIAWYRRADLSGLSVWGIVLMPLGIFLVSLAILRSGWRCWRDGGITWRGTHYPLSALRSGQLFHL